MSIEKIAEMVKAGKLKELHTSFNRGYISRKNPKGVIEPYKGKFGVGYTLHKPCYYSTNYHFITYFVFQSPQGV